MKTHLLSAIAASTLLASVSPTFAQFTPAEAVEQSRAMQTDIWSARRKAAVRRTREEPATIGSFFSKIFSPAAAENGSRAASGGGSRAAARSRSPAASGDGSSVARAAEHMNSLIASSCGIERRSCRARASRRHAREPLSRQCGGARRRQRTDADQARDRARHGLQGSAAGLLDPETNLTYGVRYLAGAYRAAAEITAARSVTTRAAILCCQATTRGVQCIRGRAARSCADDDDDGFERDAESDARVRRKKQGGNDEALWGVEAIQRGAAANISTGSLRFYLARRSSRAVAGCRARTSGDLHHARAEPGRACPLTFRSLGLL